MNSAKQSEKQNTMSKRQTIITPGPAGYKLHMVRDNLKNIPEYHLPEGYGMYLMRQDDIGVWVDVQCDAEPYIKNIDHSMFYTTFGNDLQSIGTRCFLLQNEQRCAIGTASAWYKTDEKGVEYGQVHWVALRKAYQGKGLGNALMTHVLTKLSRNHKRAFLETQSKRISAITLYLKFGFYPQIIDEEGRIGWAEVEGQIDITPRGK